MTFKSLTAWLELGTTIAGLGGAIFVFVKVQVLQAYPFYHGDFGNEPLFLGVTYTVGLEIFSLVAFAGLFSWAFSHAEGGRNDRLVKASGSALLLFGTLVATIVYVETRLLWGEVLPGVRVWQGLPGGGGYPWGSEQVAYNTCLIASSVQGNCEFLNYNELLWLAVLCGIIGFVLRNVSPDSAAQPSLAQGRKGLTPGQENRRQARRGPPES